MSEITIPNSGPTPKLMIEQAKFAFKKAEVSLRANNYVVCYQHWGMIAKTYWTSGNTIFMLGVMFPDAYKEVYGLFPFGGRTIHEMMFDLIDLGIKNRVNSGLPLGHYTDGTKISKEC